MITALLLALAAPPQVNFHAKSETRSWEPIRLAEVTKVVTQAVKEELTKKGLVRLNKSEISGLKDGDYKLLIRGRFVEEAERFSVYLSFGPGKRTEAPDLFASDTSEALGRKSRSEMRKRIERAAHKAGRRLAQAMTPYLKQQAAGFGPKTALPFAFGTIEVPKVKDKTPAIRALLDVRKPDSDRFKALRDVKPSVLDQQSARNAVERCLLFDPTAKLRKNCAEALAPLARTHVPTQRVLLHAARTEVDDDVHKKLADLASKFVGLSRLETMATWQAMLVDPGTPSRAADKVGRYLGKERNVPNLELAVTKCLLVKSLDTGKKRPCVDLVRELDPDARQRVALAYLQNFLPNSEGERTVFKDLIRAVPERGTPMRDDVVEALRRYTLVPAVGRWRGTLVYEWMRHAPKSAATVSHLLLLAKETDTAIPALRGLGEVARKEPGLMDDVESGLARLEKDNRWYRRPNSETPQDGLKKLRKSLSYAKKRRR